MSNVPAAVRASAIAAAAAFAVSLRFMRPDKSSRRWGISGISRSLENNTARPWLTSRWLARLHGGDLRLVRSEEDWTEFEVRFRLARQTAGTTARVS